MNHKKNRHYIDTHRLIQETILILLEKKDLEDITVRGICSLAGINPSTFYAHYESIYTVLGEIESVLKEDHIRYFDEEGIQWSRFLHQDGLEAILYYISEHPHFYHAYIKEMKSLSYIRSIFEELWNTNEKDHFWQNIRNKAETEALFFFFMGGALSSIELWLENGCDMDPHLLSILLAEKVPQELIGI